MKEKQHSPSFFGPLVLIGIGVFWLLSNFGISPTINWEGLFQVWPVFLIFLGVNLIVRNIRPPLGSTLSGLVGLAALGFAAMVLFAPTMIPFTDRAQEVTVVKREPLIIEQGEARSAEILIETGIAGADITVLPQGSNIVQGDVSYINRLEKSYELDGTSEAKVRIGSESGSWFMNPANWRNLSIEKWQLGINGELPTELRVDSGTGAISLDLRGADLTYLDVDSGTGAVTAYLPQGEYDLNVDTGTGASTWYLPGSGRGEYSFDTGTGAIRLYIPDGMEARIEIDSGTGGFRADDRFTLIEGERRDGVWQTADYERAANRLDIEIDSGTGGVSVERSTGR